MKCTSLAKRWKAFTFKYYAKWHYRPEESLLRSVLNEGPGDKRKKGPGSMHWIPRVLQMLGTEARKHAELSKALESFHERRANLRVIPRRGILEDEDGPWEDENIIKPVADFNRAVDSWAWDSERVSMMEEARRRGSTITLIARSLTEQTWPHQIRMTRQRASAPNLIRMRLLTGTSGLNSTLSKYRDRDLNCPFGCECEESVEHFLLHCPGYAECREEYLNEIHDHCTCYREDKTPACADVYRGIGDKDKMLFMLGMPFMHDFTHRLPEESVDTCARVFVGKAYKIRSEKLESMRSPNTLPPGRVEGGNLQAKVTIKHFFRPRRGSGHHNMHARDETF